MQTEQTYRKTKKLKKFQNINMWLKKEDSDQKFGSIFET